VQDADLARVEAREGSHRLDSLHLVSFGHRLRPTLIAAIISEFD
jgi:hypothetical protein